MLQHPAHYEFTVLIHLLLNRTEYYQLQIVIIIMNLRDQPPDSRFAIAKHLGLIGYEEDTKIRMRNKGL